MRIYYILTYTVYVFKAIFLPLYLKCVMLEKKTQNHKSQYSGEWLRVRVWGFKKGWEEFTLWKRLRTCAADDVHIWAFHEFVTIFEFEDIVNDLELLSLHICPQDCQQRVGNHYGTHNSTPITYLNVAHSHTMLRSATQMVQSEGCPGWFVHMCVWYIWKKHFRHQNHRKWSPHLK